MLAVSVKWMTAMMKLKLTHKTQRLKCRGKKSMTKMKTPHKLNIMKKKKKRFPEIDYKSIYEQPLCIHGS